MPLGGEGDEIALRQSMTAGQLPRVFIYVERFPQRAGDGANLRWYSNVRAYLDLGFEVELVVIAPESPALAATRPSADLEGLKWERIVVPPHRQTPVEKALYRLGVVNRRVCQSQLQTTDLVAGLVAARERAHPGAIHQLEGAAIASAAQFVRVRSIYSLMDVGSSLVRAVMRIACELEKRGPTAGELRELRFLDKLERRISRCVDLVLCISPPDRDAIRSWGIEHAEHLPMSLPDESPFPPRKSTLADGELRILHLGAQLQHLPTYRSLVYLFEDVMPELDTAVRNRLRIRIVGKFNPDSARCRHLLPLVANCPQAVLAGSLADLSGEFADNDIQIVFPTEATGLQTRIIESFVRGLPVMATPIPVPAVEGAEPGRNIIVSDSAKGLAREIGEVLLHPERLAGIADAARETYDRFHRRKAVASRLRDHLSRYFGLWR